VPASGSDPERAAWPFASIGRWGPYATGDGSENLGFISIVADWGQQPGNDREIFETVSHELGHNLGLWDQYAPSVPGRNPGSWDLMDWDDPHPHISIAQRMMLGWVRPAWVTSLDFSNAPVPFDQTFTLQAIETGMPAGLRRTGVEVRIADGLNYYFEYRKSQAAQIGDGALPADSRVLGTDVVGDPGTAPILRPQILLLADHANDDGAVLANGSVYIDTDYTTPGFPQEFKVDASNINGTTADIRVRYGVNGRPDPSIRPWPAAPDRPWQSPDIEVQNARSTARPEWKNTPWGGHANTVVATVRNAGTIAAPNVVVNFFVKNYTVANAPETFLGSDTKTIAPGGTETFTTTWNAPSSGHYCIIVRIPLYQVPTAPSIVEMTELNNLAQSNYDRFIPSTASPSTREGTMVEVVNPYSKPTYAYINAGQTNPVYRVLVGNRWLRLKGHETVQVPVMFEWAPVRGDDLLPDDLRGMNWDEVMKLSTVPNRVGLSSWILDPRDRPAHALGLLGGAMAEVQVGRAVRFEEVKVAERSVAGTVVTVDDGTPVTGGHVVVTLDPEGAGRPEDYAYADGRVRPNGTFRIGFEPSWKVLWCDYLPDAGFATATSDAFTQ
jgi:CARDB